MNTVKIIAIIFCMIFAIVISSMIWGEWQDYKRNKPKSLSERQEANTSYIERFDFVVAIPANGYLAVSNKGGDKIIIVDPRKVLGPDYQKSIPRW